MSKLTQEQHSEISAYIETINTKITQTKSKSMHQLCTSGLEFLQNFEVKYKSNANRLDNAKNRLDDENSSIACMLIASVKDMGSIISSGVKDMGSIISSGVKDIGSIIKEDGLGIKQYIEIEEQAFSEMDQFIKRFSARYPLSETIDVTKDISISLKKIEDEKKYECYYTTLSNLKNEIEHIENVLKKSEPIYFSLTKINSKLALINTNVSLLSVYDTVTYSHVQELEDEVVLSTKNLISNTKQFDNSVAQLVPISINDVYSN
ncbi:MAG: hypothetical protein GQ570_05170 [Helicobacteraceae bacterium]|nr:hypothetical protein [Helicobacteraceae bacterium]